MKSRFTVGLGLHSFSVLLLTGVWALNPAAAQSFNIDIDTTGTNGNLGNGVPSAAFGAAANQPGFWTSFLTTSDAIPLRDLGTNAPTGATVQVTASSTTVSVLSFNNANNSGDFALLFNDGSQIGTTTQGGTRTYSFNGLMNGMYEVYTYTGRPQPVEGQLQVDVIGSNEGALLASGLMTGNTFTEGVSHLIHTVDVMNGSINIRMTDIAGAPAGYVGGFQLTLIPEPASLTLLLSSLALLRRR
ncbi:MAG: hypothetical protein AB7N71_04570 [Phycisphaerae bacterium]